MDLTIEEGHEVTRRELVQITVVLAEYYEKDHPEHAKEWPAPEGTVTVVIAQKVRSPKVPPVFLIEKRFAACIIKGLVASAHKASLDVEVRPT